MVLWWLHCLLPLVLANVSEVSELNETMTKKTEDMELFVKLNEAHVKEYAQRMKDVLGDAGRYGWF